VTSVGFFGLPGSGKSTIFTALTRQAVEPQFLGYDLKPHQAVVRIPDPRLDALSALLKARKTVHNTVEFVDIPGFDPAGTESKLKRAVLEHYRRCDALALTVNLFDPAAAGDAGSGMRALLDELTLLDLVTVEGAAQRLEKAARLKADEDSAKRLKLLGRLHAQLEDGQPIRRAPPSDDEQRLLREYGLLSAKPVIAIFNVAEDDVARSDSGIAGMAGAWQAAEDEGLEIVRLSATMQAGLAELSDEEIAEYMAEFGVEELALPKLIRAAFDCLGLLTFFTGTEKECRAWSLRRGANAQQAAGVIHSDMARGFIRAETIAGETLVQYGGLAAARADGKVRLEGKEYIVADGDFLTIRFNV